MGFSGGSLHTSINAKLFRSYEKSNKFQSYSHYLSTMLGMFRSKADADAAAASSTQAAMPVDPQPEDHIIFKVRGSEMVGRVLKRAGSRLRVEASRGAGEVPP